MDVSYANEVTKWMMKKSFHLPAKGSKIKLQETKFITSM